jgi:hypothetical protein
MLAVPVGLFVHITLITFAITVAVTSSAQVRDVRSFEVKDSGYLGRPGGIRQDMYWLDSERVIFIGAKPGDYVVPAPGVKETRYGLYIWNVKTGAVRRHYDADIANGDLCVFRRHIRLGYTSDYRVSPAAQRWYVFEGPLGQEARTFTDQATRDELHRYQRVLNPYTCREYKRAELPALGHRVEPLLDGEFVSRSRESSDAEVVHLQYWPRKGSPVSLNMVPELIGVGRYSDFLDAYILLQSPRHVISSDTVIRRSWLMDRDGRSRDFSPPTGPWMRGSTFIAPTRHGLFLISHAVGSGGNGAAGGYLMTRGKLARIIEGLPTRFDVSKDGCHVALAISHISRDKPDTPWMKAIDLCSREG